MLLIMLFIPNMLLIMLFILNMLLIMLFIINTLLIMLFIIFNMLSDDSGVQGLIKFSATVLGPGDIQKVHDPVNEEKEAEEVMSL